MEHTPFFSTRHINNGETFRIAGLVCCCGGGGDGGVPIISYMNIDVGCIEI